MKLATTMIAIVLLASAPAHGQTSDSKAPVAASVDHEVVSFLDSLRAGKGAEGVTALLASPLWSQKAGAREAMIGQIDAAVRAYGPVTGYEKVATDRLGSLVVREYYLVQHRDMVVRWEFDLIRSASGWRVGYFGFTDQPNSWF